MIRLSSLTERVGKKGHEFGGLRQLHEFNSLS